LSAKVVQFPGGGAAASPLDELLPLVLPLLVVEPLVLPLLVVEPLVLVVEPLVLVVEPPEDVLPLLEEPVDESEQASAARERADDRRIMRGESFMPLP
jgi:hypothetical protein